MNPRELLVEVAGRQVRVWADGNRLCYSAPKGTLTPGILDNLQKQKPGLLKLLGRGEAYLAMKLRQFNGARCSLEVMVPGLEGTVWFVSGQEEVRALEREGISRGRIWTAMELTALITASGITHKDMLAIARARVAFNGDVIPTESSDPAAMAIDQTMTHVEPGPSQGNFALTVASGARPTPLTTGKATYQDTHRRLTVGGDGEHELSAKPESD